MTKPTRSSERGAILILVAVTIAVLMALAAFSVDYGVFWMSRSQVQNAADAGALAGATALALQDTTWPIPGGGRGRRDRGHQGRSGESGGWRSRRAEGVFGLPAVPGRAVQHELYSGGCVQRRLVFERHAAELYFAHIFGVSSQGVKATATAQVAEANGTGCVRPWFLVDRYTDANGNGVYDAGDSYTAPARSPTIPEPS